MRRAPATVVGALGRWADKMPRREFVRLLEEGGDSVFDFEELRERSRGVATRLLDRGVPPGSRIALLLDTSAEFLAGWLGVVWAGAVVVPIAPPGLEPDRNASVRRIRAILRDARPSALVVERNLMSFAPALLDDAELVGCAVLDAPGLSAPLSGSSPEIAEPTPSDLAVLQYTSGTTGDPRGVMLCHGNLAANLRAIRRALGTGPGDVALSWLPLYHDMGLVGMFLGALWSGARLVLMSPRRYARRPARWIEAASCYRATLTAAPNFAYALAARRPPEDHIRLDSLRTALNGSEPVLADTLDAFQAAYQRAGLGRDVQQPVYGLAEATLAVAFSAPGDPWLARTRPPSGGPELVSVGRPLDSVVVRIADASGASLDEREMGEIQVAGPSLMRGYFRRPDATAATLRDRWLCTGDLGFRLRGRLYVAGRRRDWIVRGGRKFPAHWLESVAGRVPGVRPGAVAVFAVPDPSRVADEVVVAAEVRLQQDRGREALVREIRASLLAEAGISVDRVELHGPRTLPKTTSGKLRRAEIERRYLAGGLAQAE